MSLSSAAPTPPSVPLDPAGAPHRPQLPGSERTPPARTLVELFDATAREHPDATALDDGVEPLIAQMTDDVDAARKILA